MEPQLTDTQRALLWEELIGADARSNYFAELAGSYLRRQQVATWSVLFFSSGAVLAVVISAAPTWLRLLPPILAAAVSLYSLIAENTARSVECSELHFRWNRHATACLRLWSGMYEKGASEGLYGLMEKAAEISKTSLKGAKVDRRRLAHWQDHAVAQRRAVLGTAA
jgi:hypothetical protein